MKNRKVLIVEDDEALQALYSKVINGAHIPTTTVGTGKEAVAIALAEHPDVILMDVMLPDISGHEAVQQIRRDDWGKNVPIIFLTNRTDPESVVNAVSAGSEDYIVKAHVSNQELLNKVREAMVHT
jgi:DNA-binding response OmpR family regulator